MNRPLRPLSLSAALLEGALLLGETTPEQELERLLDRQRNMLTHVAVSCIARGGTLADIAIVISDQHGAALPIDMGLRLALAMGIDPAAHTQAEAHPMRAFVLALGHRRAGMFSIRFEDLEPLVQQRLAEHAAAAGKAAKA